MKRFLIIVCLLLSFHAVAWAQEVAIPPVVQPALPVAPSHFVVDEAGVLKPNDVDSLDRQLSEFERQTSNQVIVAIYQKLPAGADLTAYTLATFNAWGVGQKEKNNGVTLFVFVQDHKLQINVGKGLEKALPDANCEKIISMKIVPFFKQRDFSAGIHSGVDAILEATKVSFSNEAPAH